MPQRERAIAIVKRLREEGYESYLAGGCVRDFLLNKTPQDFDITTSAKPTEIRRLFPHTIPVGEQFGVVLVILDGNPRTPLRGGRERRGREGQVGIHPRWWGKTACSCSWHTSG